MANAIARTEDPQEQDVLLDRLRQLNLNNPEDLDICGDLARGLSNAIWDVIFDHPYLELVGRTRGPVARRNIFFEELQALQQSHKSDIHLREKLASTISRILLAPMKGDQPAFRDGLLNILGDFCLQSDSSDDLIKIWIGTVRSVAWSEDRSFNAEAKDKLVREFESLSKSRPGDASDREALGSSLLGLVHSAATRGETQRVRELLERLHATAQANPNECWLQDHYASGVYDAFCSAKASDMFEIRDEFLEKLKVLSYEFPDELAYSKFYAKALENAYDDYGEEGNFEQRDETIVTLRELVGTIAKHDDAREALAVTLIKELCRERSSAFSETQEAIMSELRELHRDFPNLLGWGHEFHEVRTIGRQDELISVRRRYEEDLSEVARLHPGEELLNEFDYWVKIYGRPSDS